MSFKIGDIVSLKSGGAKMTVEFADEKTVACVWSDGKKAVRDNFHPETLTKGESIEDLLEQLDKAQKQPPQINVNFVGPK